MSEDQDIEREERAIYLILLAVCTPILISLLIRRGVIDGGDTVILIVVGLGIAGLVAGLRHRSRRARID